MTTTRKFREKIAEENNPNTCQITCDCCDAIHLATRRDLSIPLISFIVSLRDLINETGRAYHEFRHVIAYAKIRYGFTPSDYSNLVSGWGLVSTMDGKGNSKFKTISQYGYQFLDNELPVSIWFYRLPITGVLLYSKERKTFKELIEMRYSQSDEKSPFNFD